LPDASLLVSAVAVLISIVAVMVSYLTARRQNALQGQLVTLETAREQDRVRESRSAALRASIDGSVSRWLTIQNVGRVTARNIRLLIDNTPADEDPLIHHSQDKLTTLGVGASFRYELITSFASPTTITVLIEWEDDSGQPGSWESQLKL